LLSHINTPLPQPRLSPVACENPENLRGSVLVQGPKGLKWSAPVD